jgi:antitoxin MazE
MEKRLQNWGNSLAVRIPKEFVREAGLRPGTKCEIQVKKDCIILKPIRTEECTLLELISGITKHNRHDEQYSDQALGKEIW